MKQLSKEDIISSFGKQKLKNFKLPDLEKVEWVNLSYLGWIHRSGHLGYIVYEYKNNLTGVVLNVIKGNDDHKYKMCSLCNTLHIGSGISLFSHKTKSRTYETHGDYFCANLDCSLYLRGLKKNWAIQMREDLTIDEKLLRLEANLDKYFEKIIQ
jgi:hypothetical protein